MSAEYLAGLSNRESALLKEQLRLFAFDGATVVEPASASLDYHRLSQREKLAALLEGELDFHGENTSYASHDVHAFAAKFPPQLPRAFIRGLTSPGGVVFDPMMGSGTTIVEALLAGRRGIGFDLDPLALRLSRVKTTPLEFDSLRETGIKVLTLATKFVRDTNKIERNLTRRFDERTREFIDYWFFPETQRELIALVIAIETVTDVSVRRFMELTFSSVIVTKSGGVSRARDLAHSRPHRVQGKMPKSAIEQFAIRLKKNLISVARALPNEGNALVLMGDARAMALPDCSIDLIVTSPPYANAIDYMRAHKFSLVWFGESVDDLADLRARYIGSERVGKSASLGLPCRTESIVQKLAEVDSKKAAILRKYFVEMKLVIEEMHRVLRCDAAAVVVVGTSIMRDIDVETHTCLAEIGADVGFDVVNVARRILDRDKRMMPARWGRKTDSMIEQRMHEEYVIGLHKS